MLVWSGSCVSIHALTLLSSIISFSLGMAELTDKEDRQSVLAVLAIITVESKCDGTNITWSCWRHMFRVNWPDLFLQRHVGRLIIGVTPRQPPCHPGGVLFDNIIGVLDGLQVPWDPGIIGLRSSRFSRGGECHDLGHIEASGPSHDMGLGLWSSR